MRLRRDEVAKSNWKDDEKAERLKAVKSKRLKVRKLEVFWKGLTFCYILAMRFAAKRREKTRKEFLEE